MTVAWSPHATGLFHGLLSDLADVLLPESVYNWRTRIISETNQLADFPLLGTEIPPECFESLPPNADLLRQIIIKPYRIVYETAEDEVHILSIRHSRMLVTLDDTAWN